MVTKTTVVAKVVMAMTRRGFVFYNDRLKDGGRSLKVCGWKQSHYKKAAAMLEEMGCRVVLKEYVRTSLWGVCGMSTTIRLHVWE